MIKQSELIFPLQVSTISLSYTVLKYQQKS